MSELTELRKQVESYGFECEAGPIKNCVHWQKLRTALESTERKLAAVEEALPTLRESLRVFSGNEDTWVAVRRPAIAAIVEAFGEGK